LTLTISEVKTRGEAPSRAGTNVLSLLAAPLHVAVLGALADGPLPHGELRRAAGVPSPTTLRSHLRELEALGAIDRRRRDDFPRRVDVELTKAGRELVGVADVVSTWLAGAPDGLLELGSQHSRSALKALVEALSTGMLRALAIRPLSLTELDSLIAGVSYPSLERRLSALRVAGLLEPAPTSNGNGVPHRPTGWLRMAVPSIAAAIRWECRHSPRGAPRVSRGDIEPLFLLAVPLARLPVEFRGTCRLTILGNAGESPQAGVEAAIEGGVVTSCVRSLAGSPDGWAAGRLEQWFAAIVEGNRHGLELGGRQELSELLVARLHTHGMRSRY
jgi:DNA-binding HxlR family transcriptional regulator